jgi:zinc/manganese transport system substrate-binding protein
MKKFAVLLAALLFAAVPALADPLPVVASFSILGDMVKQVGGPDVTVVTLVGPDSDTHVYEPTPQDAKTLARATLVFVNGLGFEGWMPRLVSASGFKGKMITASKGITPRTMVDEDEKTHPTITDPHAWQNLSNGLIYVQNIAEALEAALPGKAQDIAARASAYEAQIKTEDDKVRQEFAAVPAAQRKIITSHDAFGYFGAAYGITFLAPEGLSTEAEPSAAALATLIDQMKSEGIKTVFLENMTSPRLATQLAKEGGAQLGAELYSDALSPPDGPAPTYISMFENNVPKLKAAMMENGAP